MERCNCIETLNNKVLQARRKDFPDREYKDITMYGDFGFKNIALGLGGGGELKPYFEFKLGYTFIKTNGQISFPKTETVSIYPTYCPFCGRKYEKGASNE